ncbi:MAG: GNAT family N-acetyltransferase [Thermoproteota archaeon]
MSPEESIRVVEVSEENIGDLCSLCVPSERLGDSIFMKGVELKKTWVKDMLRRWGSVAKVAYLGETPAGFIQYVPIPDERVVHITCIFVPRREHWRKGIGRRLLTSLIEDMRRPKEWFGGEPPLALVTKPFPGEKPGQYPARSFFKDMGFKQVEANPNLLYYPLKQDFKYVPPEQEEPNYFPQEDDKGKAVILYNPSFCPFSYFFLKKSEQEIEKAIPGISIRWINGSEEPEEIERRGISGGIIVNARLIRASLLVNRDAFLREVFDALKGT